MYNLRYQDKPVEQLDYEETVEFEKELMKRMLNADRHGMSDQVIQQLQNYLDYVKMYQQEALERMRMGLDGRVEPEEDEPEKPYSLIIGEPEPNEDESE